MSFLNTENLGDFIFPKPNFDSLQEVIIMCLSCFLERGCPRDGVCVGGDETALRVASASLWIFGGGGNVTQRVKYL